ncbi:MAG: CBS domain-containing protein [Ramlibacter sp.]|nr:CBS domain-containing protein [Ramlibacter sp.]
MNIAGLCQRVIVTIGAQASMHEAAVLMRDEHVGSLVVTDTGNASRVVGVLTDRDLAIEFLAREAGNEEDIRVGELASGALVAVPGTASILEAVAAMDDCGVRRLLVTGDEGRIVGIVSAEDLLDTIAAELDGLARALRSGIDRETAEVDADRLAGYPPMFLLDALVAPST